MPRKKITKAQHRRLNWSTSIVNKMFRNALHVSGKIVAATDYDLVIYTPKGAAVILEQKNLKQSLEQNGEVAISKLQLDHLLNNSQKLTPKPNVMLVVYDADEVEAQQRKALVYVCGLQKAIKNSRIAKAGRYGSNQYCVPRQAFTKMRLEGLIDFCNKICAKPMWQKMSPPKMTVNVNTINRRLCFYVAGPYLAVPKPDEAIDRHSLHKCVRETALNAERAIRIGIELMKRGHLVFIPHLSHYIHQLSDVEFDDNYWYDFDNVWLDKCDALFLVSTKGVNGALSKGTLAEIERAKANKLYLYTSIDEVPFYEPNSSAKFE